MPMDEDLEYLDTDLSLEPRLTIANGEELGLGIRIHDMKLQENV